MTETRGNRSPVSLLFHEIRPSVGEGGGALNANHHHHPATPHACTFLLMIPLVITKEIDIPTNNPNK